MGSTPGTADLADLYRDLHRHPELSFQETRTAGIAAERLRAIGFETTASVGGTGVVGVLRTPWGGSCCCAPTWTGCRCLIGAAAELAGSRETWAGRC